MQFISRRSALASVFAGAALGAGLSPLASAKTNMKGMAGAAHNPAKPDIAFYGEGFAPMTSHIVAGGTITFISDAAEPLHLMSAPSAPAAIRRVVAPSAAVSMRFTEPGLYLLYDATTTRFDPKVRQVVARRDASQFPLPAYTVILVTTANGRGLTTTPPRIIIPDSYMTFEPWATVVNAGEAITFINNDMDAHIVMPSPEPMLMPNSSGEDGHPNTALWLEHMQSFAPITLAGKGGKGVLTLSEPGLHHYYCPVHAAYDATAFTFAPLKSYGGYPFIMDGVIVVLPT